MHIIASRPISRNYLTDILIGAQSGLAGRVLQREINYTLYSQADWKKRKAAKDSFVLEVLMQPRITLLGDPDALQ